MANRKRVPRIAKGKIADEPVLELGPPGPPTNDVDMLGRVTPEARKRQTAAAAQRVIEGRVNETLPSDNNGMGTAKDDGPNYEAFIENAGARVSNVVQLPPFGMKEHKVIIKQDHGIDMPELYHHFYIHGPDWERRAFATLIGRSRCKFVELPEDADFVLFTGGIDVNPALYGEERHTMTDVGQTARDDSDIDMYLFCLQKGIPMIGICRGAQFLHVMQPGGKLFQHVDNHNGNHNIMDLVENKMVQTVSSVHHQMVQANVKNGMRILATAAKSMCRWKNKKDMEKGPNADIEAFFYRDTMVLGVQGHPEYEGYPYYSKWFLEQVQKNILNCPDLHYDARMSRIKPEIMEERKASITAAVDRITKLKGLK